MKNKKLMIKIKNLSTKPEDFGIQPTINIQNNFFLNKLKYERDCEFLCKTQSVSDEMKSGSLLLFKYNNKIIASAIFKEKKEYSEPIDGVYHCSCILEKNTINVFSEISAEEIKDIDGSFSGFGQQENVIDYSYHDEIEDLITKKKNIWEKNNNKKSTK